MPSLSHTMKTLSSSPISFPTLNPISSLLSKTLLKSPLLPSHFFPPLLLRSPISSLPSSSSHLLCFKPFSSLTPIDPLSPAGLVDSSDPMMETWCPFGAVHVIVGPMFAGKTTALLRRVQSERDNGRKVAIIKSNKDTRYGLDSIVTHDGAKFPCWALPDLLSFREKVGADEYEKLDVIGIDEAQFFEDLYEFCSKAADHDGKTVIVAGLDGDYLRRSFGSVLDIIPVADSVTKLTARCELCGKSAYFTLRKTEERQTELIGGADVYMPVCRKHYVNGQVIIEAARSVLEPQRVQCDPYVEATPVSSS